ncbi:MAG: hypothetical protein AAGD07_15415, partial [Planctomycetota bacterium]
QRVSASVATDLPPELPDAEEEGLLNREQGRLPIDHHRTEGTAHDVARCTWMCTVRATREELASAHGNAALGIRDRLCHVGFVVRERTSVGARQQPC